MNDKYEIKNVLIIIISHHRIHLTGESTMAMIGNLNNLDKSNLIPDMVIFKFLNFLYIFSSKTNNKTNKEICLVKRIILFYLPKSRQCFQ